MKVIVSTRLMYILCKVPGSSYSFIRLKSKMQKKLLVRTFKVLLNTFLTSPIKNSVFNEKELLYISISQSATVISENEFLSECSG